jgi:hypothetical protein
MEIEEANIQKLESSITDLLQQVRALKAGQITTSQKQLAAKVTKPVGIPQENVIECPRKADPCKVCGKPILFMKIKSNKNPKGWSWYLADADGQKHHCPDKPAVSN